MQMDAECETMQFRTDVYAEQTLCDSVRLPKLYGWSGDGETPLVCRASEMRLRWEEKGEGRKKKVLLWASGVSRREDTYPHTNTAHHGS